ncbi:hypothetical protein DSO57_1015268 [Entomophthora muscae]|uniref:Uncharacterized protein n=1 Tax=Entomophthora muscae TaxID=34485 RepID=A0ACC2U3J6_9FUNG|nr:hypothetical protein DSO57_1015268 [Entomophthora muscae]
MGGLSDSQYGTPQDQTQPVPVPHSGDWATVAPSIPIQSSPKNSGQVNLALSNMYTSISSGPNKQHLVINAIVETTMSHNQSDMVFAEIATHLQFIKAVNNNILILVLKPQESNSGPQGMSFVNQDEQELANMLSCRLESVSFPLTCQLSEKNIPNEDQIVAGCTLSRAKTYAEVVSYQKEVEMRLENKPSNNHQLPPAPSVKLIIQLVNSSNTTNRTRETKHHHLSLPEPAKPEFVTLEALP